MAQSVSVTCPKSKSKPAHHTAMDKNETPFLLETTVQHVADRHGRGHGRGLKYNSKYGQ